MVRKQDNIYFEMFIRLADYCGRAAQNLNETLDHYDPAKLPQTMEYMHEIEHAADTEKHMMMRRLAKEFITPIDREDIMNLAQEIDEVTDSIEDVLLKLYMFNIQSIRRDALEFSKIILSCCACLKRLMEEFGNFRKSPTIQKEIIEMNRLENEGDRLYTEALHHLCTTSTDAVEILSWTQAFIYMEKCCDACEHAANVVESVILKNT